MLPAVAERSRPALLYLVHRFPYPPDKGDRIRAFQLLRELAKWADVDLACLADEPVADESVAALRRYCRRVAVAPVGGWRRWARTATSLALGGTATVGAFSSPSLRDTLRRWAGETPYHAVLASASGMAPYFRMPELRDVPAVIDLVDVDSQKWLDYAATSRGPRAWLYGLEGRRLRRLEREIALWARALTLVTDAEVGLFRRFCAEGQVEAIGNGVDLDYFAPRPEAAEEGCVFVGALDYRPNIDGAVWFCREVWPAIHQARPQARMRLVGRQPAPAVQRLTEVPGVELVGQVADVRPYVARAAVAVVPLRIARGVQNKVLEALAMGKATVVSPQAREGLRAEPGVHLLEVDSPAQWASTVLRLLDDAALRRRLGLAGRRYVEQEHRWERCLRPFAALVGIEETRAADLPQEGRADFALTTSAGDGR
jgi:sugar transferase (PEP-CTERM/EpsH1 system associated)